MGKLNGSNGRQDSVQRPKVSSYLSSFESFMVWPFLFCHLVLCLTHFFPSKFLYPTPHPPPHFFFLNQSYLFLVNIWVVFFASSVDKDACKERFLMLWTKYKKVCLFPHSLYLYFDHTSIFFIAHLQWLA